MKNKFLNLLLLMTIILQSFITVANSQETHEVDVQHIQTEHSHESDRQIVDNKQSTGNEHNVKDCHHCGHCHGFHCPFITQTQATIEQELQVFHSYLYSIQYAHAYTDNPLIPPIS